MQKNHSFLNWIIIQKINPGLASLTGDQVTDSIKKKAWMVLPSEFRDALKMLSSITLGKSQIFCNSKSLQQPNVDLLLQLENFYFYFFEAYIKENFIFLKEAFKAYFLG